VSLPAIRLEKDYLNGLLATPPMLQFEHIPIEWGDFRFLLRASAAAMRSHEALDDSDFRRIENLCRDAAGLPIVLRSWYEPVPHTLGRRHHGQDRPRRVDRRIVSALRRRA
jgi:hypothetical protein